MTDIRGSALITGASSGLGAIYADRLTEAAHEAVLPNLSRKEVAARYRRASLDDPDSQTNKGRSAADALLAQEVA